MPSDPSMASPANSIPDTHLGLSRDEVILLRQHQQVALSQAGASRAASNASSQGLLLLDSGSLHALGHHFDRLMSAIQHRMQSGCLVARSGSQLQLTMALDS